MNRVLPKIEPGACRTCGGTGGEGIGRGCSDCDGTGFTRELPPRVTAPEREAETSPEWPHGSDCQCTCDPCRDGRCDCCPHVTIDLKEQLDSARLALAAAVKDRDGAREERDRAYSAADSLRLQVTDHRAERGSIAEAICDSFESRGFATPYAVPALVIRDYMTPSRAGNAWLTAARTETAAAFAAGEARGREEAAKVCERQVMVYSRAPLPECDVTRRNIATAQECADAIRAAGRGGGVMGTKRRVVSVEERKAKARATAARKEAKRLRGVAAEATALAERRAAQVAHERGLQDRFMRSMFVLRIGEDWRDAIGDKLRIEMTVSPWALQHARDKEEMRAMLRDACDRMLHELFRTHGTTRVHEYGTTEREASPDPVYRRNDRFPGT